MNDASSPYMEAVSAARSLRLSDKESLEGQTLLSVETEDDLEKSDTFTFFRENPASFMRLAQMLPSVDHDALLSYYFLCVPQHRMAAIFLGGSQTQASWRLRRATKALCCFIAFGGTPTAEQLHSVIPAEHEDVLSVPLSTLIYDYNRCRSYIAVARKHRVRREDVRREISRCWQALYESPDEKMGSVAAWIATITEGASAVAGYKDRGVWEVTRTDPDWLGEFRVRVEDVDELFSAKAAR